MQILPITWTRQIKHFTLMELVVVIAIIAVTTSLAVSTFRGESPSVKLENATLEFQLFCSQVRYRAIEDATDKIISYDTSSQHFIVENASEDSEASSDSSIITNLFWELPEGFELNSDFISLVEATESGKLELFRFFANGSATSPVEFVLSYKKLQRRFVVSPLTGLMTYIEIEENSGAL